jgi:predicted TIM-barrel fold metal-dependent hydrolase
VIIDCHSHVWEVPEHISPELLAEAGARARGSGVNMHVPPERHWEAMKNVDRAIVFGMRAFHVGIVTPNEYIADYVNQHPDKLIGFAGVDPTRDNVQDTLDHAIGDLKLRGVKLGPIYQNLHPLDERLLPVYAYCERRNLPIMIHQATTFPRKAPLRYALPIDLEDVALKFPDLKMILAHMGHPWIEETIVLIRKQPNLFTDISALHYRPYQFFHALMTAKEYGVLDKVLFGSDFPFTTPDATIRDLRTINELSPSPRARISEEEIERLIQSPTLQLLGLE